MDSSSNNDYVNQFEMSNPQPEDERLPTVTDRNVSEHGHGIFLNRNIRRRLADRRFNTDNLPNSSSTGPRETTSLQDNVMANHGWVSPSSSSSFHGGESSRQAEERTSSRLNENGNENEVGNMNLNPWSISDINSWNGHNQTLMDVYQSFMGHIPALQPIYGALATLHPSIADNAPERMESASAAAASGFGVPMPMGPLTGGQQQGMVLDNSFILDFDPDSSDEEEGEFPDAYRDMRIDVEGMSYEELLDLGDDIGTVDTGLPEEDILAHLKRMTYKSLKLEPPVGDDLCSICREDYADEDDLGQLDCRHIFHFQCIKQWLLLKNVCPICKMKALSV